MAATISISTGRSFALCLMNAAPRGLSITGLVFGMTATPVNPPATAALLPVSRVSLYSCPGSLKWQCMSNSPDATTLPSMSMIRSSCTEGTVSSPRVIVSIIPVSETFMEPCMSRFCAGFISLAFWKIMFMVSSLRQLMVIPVRRRHRARSAGLNSGCC